MSKFGIGEFEQLVLLALVRLGGESYGVPIIEELESRTDREVSHAALYLTLRRMESKGWLSSRTEPQAPRGGRPRRYYQIQAEGVERLRASRETLLLMWDGITGELEP